MANIKITGADFLSQGTAGDDVVTYDTALAPTSQNVGNTSATDTGMDSAILADATSAFATVTYTAGTGWAFAGGATFDDAFSSIEFADGITLEAGVALSDDVLSFASAGVSVAAGTYTADILGAGHTSSLAWSGTALTATTIDAVAGADAVSYSITKFDGNLTSASTTAIASDAKGQLTVNAAGTGLEFTPDTTAITGSDMGDTVDFTYTVELTGDDDPANIITVDITYSVDIDWTTGADTLDLSGDSAAAGVTVTEGAAVTLTDADGNVTTVAGSGDTGGDDNITGGAFDDTITMVGSAGANTLKGGGGVDTIDASSITSTDVQLIGGGAGDDVLTGGSGADKIAGGGGKDQVNGGAGDDVIQGLGGNDDVGTGLSGGAGNDTIRGGAGDDIINGDADDDELRGGAGTDVVSGGAGNDTLFTSLGGDTLDGDAGNDVFMLKSGTGTTTILNFGVGVDQLDVTALGWTSMADVDFYETTTTDTVLILDDDTTVVLDGFIGLSAAVFEFA